VVVGAAAAAHGITLALHARAALASRFGSTVRYYVGASLALPIGAGLGTALARDPVEPWHGRLVVAHVTLNLLGWIGLTVMGTLVTLWPTMLRTRIAEGAERVARQALPILGGSVVVSVAGALCGLQALAAAGVAAYLGGVLWAVRPLSRVARTKPPVAYATWSVMAAVIWLMGSLLGLVTVLVISPTWRLVTDRLGLLIIPLAAGFAAQILLGALSFLVPVVLGGGPTILRGTQGRMNRGSALRAVLINVGLLVCIVPVPSEVRVLVAILVAGAFAMFLPLLVCAALYAVRAKSAGRRSVDRSPMPRHVPAAAAVTRGRNTRQAAVALALVILAAALGYALAR
jgi:nitrite reductase (NO-forming)